MAKGPQESTLNVSDVCVSLCLLFSYLQLYFIKIKLNIFLA